MKIAQVGKFYPPHHGGMERVVSELSEGLAARGHLVRAITSSTSGPATRENRNGVEVVRLRTWANFFAQPVSLGFSRELRDFEPNIVHFHAPNPLALTAALTIGSKTPFCLTIHAETDGWRKKVDRAVTSLAMKKARAVVFSSTESAKSWTGLEDLSLEPKVRIIPFGFRFNYLVPRAEAQDSRLILFVGRLVPYKGLDYLIRAMAHVSGHLAIIGDGVLRKELEELARQLGLSEKVKFIGAVSDQALSSWYETCSIYVQPSISNSESFGITMLEAMRFAKPVVSTNLSTGVRSVNRHQTTGWVVPPRDESALAQALNSLLENPDLAHRLGKGALKHLSNFEPQEMIDAHLALYTEILS